ncbi:MAG: DsbA family protein [Candidatus Omnitrophota bacterium]
MDRKIITRYLLTGIFLVGSLVLTVQWARSQQERTSPVLRQDFKTKGRIEAPITIVEYSDFQCPACRAAAQTAQKILSQYPKDIIFVFRHFPLRGHPISMIAHQAAECAAEQRQFWPFHDRLYQDQAVWGVALKPAETFLQYAKEMQLDLEAFAACLASPEVTAKIEAEKEEGNAHAVRATPTFFIGEERFVGAIELEKKGIPLIEELRKRGS